MSAYFAIPADDGTSAAVMVDAVGNWIIADASNLPNKAEAFDHFMSAVINAFQRRSRERSH
jgi:hypothetical protein